MLSYSQAILFFFNSRNIYFFKLLIVYFKALTSKSLLSISILRDRKSIRSEFFIFSFSTDKIFHSRNTGLLRSLQLEHCNFLLKTAKTDFWWIRNSLNFQGTELFVKFVPLTRFNWTFSFFVGQTKIDSAFLKVGLSLKPIKVAKFYIFISKTKIINSLYSFINKCFKIFTFWIFKLKYEVYVRMIEVPSKKEILKEKIIIWKFLKVTWYVKFSPTGKSFSISSKLTANIDFRIYK